MATGALPSHFESFNPTHSGHYGWDCHFPPNRPQIPMLKSNPLGPQNVTVFGDRVFEEVIKVKRVIWVGPNPIWLVSFY